VEALTRGLVNKFLHPPMQALKQAARLDDSVRLDALCETWSLPTGAERETEQGSAAGEPSQTNPIVEKAEGATVSEPIVESRR